MQISLDNTPNSRELTALFLATFTDSEGEQEGQSVSSLVESILETTPKEKMWVYTAKDERLVGAILFTEMTTSTKQQAYLLSPVAIATSHQGRGVGQKLIQHAIDDLTAKGVQLLFTYGDPAFYGKVGFERLDSGVVQPPHSLSYPHGWLGQSLVGDELVAMTTGCVSAFNQPELW